MRVIAGSARRTQLKTLEGMDTRPTTDRIKETLFNMIAPYLYDSIFLDLFAGSGGIGRDFYEPTLRLSFPNAFDRLRSKYRLCSGNGERPISDREYRDGTSHPT